ncbi:methionine adenosyltransferase [Candidatus Woesearchaeota archaeon]|nr:methionine adenosyltransferase [Candidatus Woesearchaeota archaeon]
MGVESRLFSSESVTVGHPDKVADRISDAVLDDVLSQDPNSRVACETFCPGGSAIFVGGEITTSGWVDIERIAKDLIRETGYTNPDYGLDYRTVTVSNLVKPQVPEIAQGVNEGEGLHKEQGAGDQGHMFGFAIKEADEYMPLPIMLAHKLAHRLETVRNDGTISYLRPDGKIQVTVEYGANGKPVGVHTIVVSTQHNKGVEHGQIVADVKEHVILPIAGNLVSDSTSYHINPTGSFVIGGPAGDAGLTGRKIIVDTYGGGSLLYRAGHGGGAFSGKDPSKVDRSAAYAARYIAKNIIAADLADVCEVQLAYAIGVAEPVSVMVNTFGTGKGITEGQLAKKVRDNFPLKPADIISHFDLKRPIYLAAAVYGHFGRSEFPWEKLDKVDVLQK